MSTAHMLLIVQGGYTSALPTLSSEMWQFGVRLLVAAGSAPDPLGPLPSQDDVHPVADTVSISATNWDITGNWRWESGIHDLDVGSWLNDQVGPAVRDLLYTDAGGIGGTLFSNRLYVSRIMAAPIGQDGTYIPAPPYASGTPITLTPKTQTYLCGKEVNAPIIPPQCATVVSTRTAQIGPGARGRFFLPALNQNLLNASGGFDAGKTANIAGAAKLFLENISFSPLSPPGVFAVPAVMATVAVGSGKREYASYAYINQARVGSVVDTQRRRRRSIPETFSVVSVDTP